MILMNFLNLVPKHTQGNKQMNKGFNTNRACRAEALVQNEINHLVIAVPKCKLIAGNQGESRDEE